MSESNILDKVISSKKYKDLDGEFLNNFLIFISYNDVDRVKSKLHQIWGAYYSSRPNFDKLLNKLSKNEISLFDVVRVHSSTKERLNDFVKIFEWIKDTISDYGNVLDLGCGLNPILFSLSNIEVGKYYAVDIDKLQQAFLNKILDSRFDVKVGSAFNYKFPKVKTTFLFKLLPVLDQIKEGEGISILERLNSEYIVVSLPSRSLGGHNKGMVDNYRHKYIDNLPSHLNLVAYKEFTSETIYILKQNRTISSPA